jgi:hypothetical protein
MSKRSSDHGVVKALSNLQEEVTLAPSAPDARQCHVETIRTLELPKSGMNVVSREGIDLVEIGLISSYSCRPDVQNAARRGTVLQAPRNHAATRSAFGRERL